jgi:hypothetical protein
MKIFTMSVQIVLIFFVHKICAQDFNTGARTRALGNACIADTSAWSLLKNPAGTAHVKTVALLLSDEQLYGIQDIKSFSAGLLVPVKKKFVLGLTFHKQGYEWFNDQQIGIHAAHNIGPYNLSVSFLLWQRIAGETFHKTYPIVNIGGTMSLNKAVQLGLHISNVTNTQNEQQTIPLQIQGGMLYKLSRQLLFYTDLVKQSNTNISLHTGMEYKIHSNFFLRTGIQTKPMRLNGGIGFSNKHLSVDYSLSWQSPLGCRHQLSACIFVYKK